jgi:hypothetical protein
MTAFERAIELIDAANEDDPNQFGDEPLALAQGRLAHGWAAHLDHDASEALILAARAHHLRRWIVPRSSYPDGRPGYLQWRRDQKERNAVELTELLVTAGVESDITDRAAEIVLKKGLGQDPEVQTYEDAVCLTFIETQFAPTADRLDEDRMVEVVAKTLAKMSEAGRAAALTITLDDRDAELVNRALERLP